ncbi:DUF4232 domain-containing protein [Streptomyces sp. NPDC051041]|uniref:DUF4232 domain-containing protein n=1 Tax=Streptomyces sp. NPDC051041 TaxID=3365640 RepID=UPI00379651DD
MRATAIPFAVSALCAALLLTACDDGGSGGGTDDGGEAAPAGTACRLDEVGVQVEASPAPAAGDTGTVSVVLTNNGSSCTLDGFPTVTLAAGTTTADVPHDQAAAAQQVTLAQGATASFTVTYARGEAGGAQSLAAEKATFALPGDSATHGFPWSYGEVALEGEGAPDASVTPFQQAGD